MDASPPANPAACKIRVTNMATAKRRNACLSAAALLSKPTNETSGRTAPLVVSLFIDIGRGRAKHEYAFERSTAVDAPYLVWCSPAACDAITGARAALGLKTETVKWDVPHLLSALAQELNVAPTMLWAAAQQSVTTVHCPSPELVLLWLAKLYLVKQALGSHPLQSGFAWVDAGLHVCRFR